MRAKKELLKLLEENRCGELSTLVPGKRKLLTLLISSTYDIDKVTSWRAMEVIGTMSGDIAKTNTESVRDLVNRLLWMVRDESGTMGRSVPGILGEIVMNNPVLCSDIATIITSFHDEKMLTAGVMRAIGRIGKINNEAVDFAVPVITSYLNDPDSTIRGHAVWAAGELEISSSIHELEKMRSDSAALHFYEDGELKEKSVGEIASKALAKFKLNAAAV